MEDDILDALLNDNVVPFKDEAKSETKVEEETPKPISEGNTYKKNNFSKGKSDDLWADTNIVKKEPDMSKFEKQGRSFVVALGGTPDEKAKETLTKLVMSLGSKNFVMRYQYNDNIQFLKTLADIEGVTIEAYVPWKKMAPDLANVAKYFATRLAYEYAHASSAKFNSFPPAVRCIRANAMHCMLGPKLTNPVDLVLAWTECGSEAITKDTDFKTLGNTGTFITYAKNLNIPFFNIKKDTSIKNLVEYIKNI